MCYWKKIQIGGGSSINNKLPARKLMQQILATAFGVAVPGIQAFHKRSGSKYLFGGRKEKDKIVQL